MLTKRKLIYTLIFISLVLIIANILIDKFADENLVVIEETPQKVIEEKFQQVLNEYGIIDDWISKKIFKRKSSDSLKSYYQIYVPADISIASLIKDINKSFINYPVTIESVEEKNYSNSEISIFSNNIIKLKGVLKHSSKIKREYSEVSFVVKIDETITDEILESFKKLYFNYAIVFTPSEFSAGMMDQFDCDHLVLINDEIEDSRFLLEEDFSKQRLINSVKEIIITYGRKTIYLIDKESTIYNSKVYSLVEDEFEKRGIVIKDIKSITPLNADTEKQLYSLFNFYITSLKGKDGKIFLINYKDLISLIPQIEKQIKMGDRVTKPIIK